MGSGKRRVLYRGTQLFSQGSPQDGIFLIESGRIKVFYIAPSGREITLAYWHSGNFVGGPEVFKQGLHIWSGEAAVNSTVLHLPGDILRKMVLTIPAFAVGIIEGLSFKGQCYSALAQMLGTRSPTERLDRAIVDFTQVVLSRQANIAIYFREEKNLAPDALTEINALRKKFDRVLSKLLAEGVAAGEFDIKDVSLAALAIGGMISWAYTWHRPEGRLALDDMCERMADLALQMVGARSKVAAKLPASA